MTNVIIKKKRLKIFMSERAPVSVDPDEWPTIASGSDYSGAHECQANETWFIKVREHQDGRRLVYGSNDAGPGGMRLGWRGNAGGFLLPSDCDKQETVRAIRRVAGIIGNDRVADECIGDLPPERL